MKKAILIGLITATALMPVAASAQQPSRLVQRAQENHARAQAAEARPAAAPQQSRGDRQAAPAPQPRPAQSSQSQGRRQGNGNWQGQQGQRPAQPRYREDSGVALRDRAARAANARLDAQDQRQGGGDWQDGRRDGGRRDGNWSDGRRDNDWRDGRGDGRRDWNRGWRNDRRYSWQDYRRTNRGAYRLPRYYAPRGWGYGYRRFSVGLTLSSLLFSQSYWINDPFYYRLPPAYGPYRWVRYYNDAMLVDVRSGRVVDVIYDIFW